MLRTFDINDELHFHALVFADTAIEALELAGRQADAVGRAGATSFSAVPRAIPAAGAAGDSLRVALARGVKGIGHLQDDGSWVIMPAGSLPSESCTPTAKEMHTFIDGDGDEYVIFASDWDRAVAIYAAFLTDPKALPRDWEPLTHYYWSTLGLVRHQVQAEARGVEGLGLYSPAGWVLLAIPYERLELIAP